MNILETSRPIAIKFYSKHHWGWGKADLGLGPNQIRTLVSMATDSALWVIMWKILKATLAPSFFDRIFFILAGNDDNHKVSNEFVMHSASFDHGLWN